MNKTGQDSEGSDVSSQAYTEVGFKTSVKINLDDSVIHMVDGGYLLLLGTQWVGHQRPGK